MRWNYLILFSDYLEIHNPVWMARGFLHQLLIAIQIALPFIQMQTESK